MSVFDDFTKKHDYLVCVDSDGCAMDTMNCKHIHCFGPCMVDQWALDAWREPILKRWNEINLYQLTRGINRFLGLAMALEEIDRQYTPIPGLETLRAWTEHTSALSNDALEQAIAAAEPGAGRTCLEKALAWSRDVNRSIVALPEELKVPYPGAKEALAAASAFADVAVVSSANRDAVEAEWAKHGLLDHTDILLAQDCGSKAHCISEMLRLGYDPAKVLMVGDAPGDLSAAETNGVAYYPILVGHEAESWRALVTEALPRLAAGTYDEDYQQARNQAFRRNLGG